VNTLPHDYATPITLMPAKARSVARGSWRKSAPRSADQWTASLLTKGLSFGVLAFAEVTAVTYPIARDEMFTGYRDYDDEGYIRIADPQLILPPVN
jgi:hypothetical protein